MSIIPTNKHKLILLLRNFRLFDVYPTEIEKATVLEVVEGMNEVK